MLAGRNLGSKLSTFGMGVRLPGDVENLAKTTFRLLLVAPVQPSSVA